MGLPVTIVSGLPRSGTSMMMRMLAAGGMPVLVDNLRPANEDNPGGYFEFEPVKRTKQDPSWLALAPGKAVKMVYRLLYDLPATHEYRVLVMRRPWEEVLTSQRKMLRREGRAHDAGDADLAALFREDMARFDQWLASQSNFASLDVDYVRTIADPGAATTAIDEFLGGGLNRAAMCGVVDEGLYRNRGGN